MVYGNGDRYVCNDVVCDCDAYLSPSVVDSRPEAAGCRMSFTSCTVIWSDPSKEPAKVTPRSSMAYLNNVLKAIETLNGLRESDTPSDSGARYEP